jgi:N-acetyl sugar amidotransferase
MDTSDPDIVFNDSGESDYYLNFTQLIKPNWLTDDRGLRILERTAADIRDRRKRSDFDCIIGISGGLDSSYTAYVATKIMGLKPLLFHVDAGWNTDKAVGNIEKICEGLNVDLYTEVINWEEMKDLQRAYLFSQVPGQDAPQDIAFFSALYKFARKHRIKYVLTGGNFSTECCREPAAWGAYAGIDKRNVLDIHQRFGSIKLETFPILDIFEYKAYYQGVLGMRVFKPLNYLPYIKKDAEHLLATEYCWEPFKHKHHESRFTRFYEDFWLPRKFGFDKRRAHFSSLILTGQMTREEALTRISKPELDELSLKNEFDFVAEKLGFTPEELQRLFEGKNTTCLAYRNKRWLIDYGASILRLAGLERRLMR